jgi:hypothetical protein
LFVAYYPENNPLTVNRSLPSKEQRNYHSDNQQFAKQVFQMFHTPVSSHVVPAVNPNPT